MVKNNKKITSIEKRKIIEEHTISLTDIILILASQLKLIILIPSIICSGALVYLVFLAEPIYTSSSKIMSSSSKGMSQAAGIAAQLGISMPINQNETQWVYPEIIQSRIIARKMLSQKFDTIEFGIEKTLLEILIGKDQELDPKSEKVISNGINEFLDMIVINEDKKTNIITLNVNSKEAKFASELNQALIKKIDAHQREYNKNKTSETRKFIEERITATEIDLRRAEENLKDFISSNRRIENSALLQLERQRLAREVTVLTGIFTTLKQQFETTKIEEVKESQYIVVIDPPEPPLKPSKPRKARIMFFSGIIGLALGTIFGFFREFLSNGEKEDMDKLRIAKTLFYKNVNEIFLRKSS
tara:strand:+ start:160 stop:1236 length:1077 start_codon:yes stop_codon:yes gene_type:complete